MVLLIVGLILLIPGVTALLLDVNYANVPPEEKLLNPERTNQDIAFDLWGRTIRQAEAERLKQSPEGAQMLSATNEAIGIDAEFQQRGRKAFYVETFGNEHFDTDVLGLTGCDGGQDRSLGRCRCNAKVNGLVVLRR